jgi:hypothetical protein
MESYPLGSLVRFSETFTNTITGALADPTTVVIKFRDPAGVETSYSLAGGQVVRDSIGAFHFDLQLNTTGTWLRRWVGGGAVIAPDERPFAVEKSGFTSP